MSLTDKNCIFYIQKLLKTSKPGKHLGRLEFRSFEEDKKLTGLLQFLQNMLIIPS